MKFPQIARRLPSWKNMLLAILSAILLILAFPDFECWFLAWFALVPLLIAVERQKESWRKSFFLGWLWGVVFFFGTCWWLAYAPIHYAAFPPLLAYFLVLCGAMVAAVFPGIFALITSTLLRCFCSRAFFAVPFVWVATEFARYWLTGNNWNAIGYSQAFNVFINGIPKLGGLFLVSGVIGFGNVLVLLFFQSWQGRLREVLVAAPLTLLTVAFVVALYQMPRCLSDCVQVEWPEVVVVQPNVPMTGLNYESWKQLRDQQIKIAEQALSRIKAQKISEKEQVTTTVILPESPMNYQWDEDREFRQFITDFAARNNVNVLFNSAEPDPENKKYFNSAVMIDPTGREIAQYDKIYLLPFGEAVPVPFESIVPAFVGNFSYGKNYSLVPLGDAKAGIMICFESHFGQLSREYVLRGADAIIEMTNDGYLGPTPVLRQHLSNAVFRAIETNRPVLRVTNVGITAYINERGEVLDATRAYTEDTRVWSVAKSDGSQTFYVKYGDWFAWLSTLVTIMLLAYGFLQRRKNWGASA